MASYRTKLDSTYFSDAAHALRWQKTLAFLRESEVVGTNCSLGLDLGDRTPLTTALEELFACTFHNSTIDLDVGSLFGSYNVVTAFEVLEHLYNPLHLLLQVRNVLRGNDARLFVSMPLWKPHILASPDHFHEMTRRAALSLFERAGFAVVRRAEFRIREPLFYVTGIKPLLRAWYEKIQIYELAMQVETVPCNEAALVF
uniref:Uncharacterized protein n=1 Tax=Chlorobium chlorochromatii (strain CaD3) TaxID=340177 RepID=Q3APG0_CHLCH